MDDLSEREQIERIRQWWRENGWYIIGGLALGVLLLTGWNRYHAYQEGRAEQAAAVYQQLADAVRANNAGSAQELLATLRADHRASPYTAQGGLLMAQLQMRQNEPRVAAATLREIMGSAPNREMALVARLRLARVLAYLEEYDEALALLAIDEPGTFGARYHEARGDIHVARGDMDPAREAYMQALIAPGAELVDRAFVQMKLSDLAVADATPLPGELALPAGEPAPGALPPLEVEPGTGSVLDDLPPAGDLMDEPPASGAVPDAPADDDAPASAQGDGS